MTVQEKVNCEMNDFEKTVANGDGLRGLSLSTIQVNVGLRCNLACLHCHVLSSPKRKEEMDWPTMERVVDVAKEVNAQTVDITGGAPEMNPNFKRFVAALRANGHKVMVRTNLTILLEPGMEDTAEFMRDRHVHLVASLPCYLQENVDAQRGRGVYYDSVKVLQMLNELGYGRREDLPLDLVYNPVGEHLPPPQESLEEDYKRELKKRFGIDFTNLLTITNMPIGRYWRDLKRHDKHDEYLNLLKEAYNPRTVDDLMCRHQIEIGWDGTIYDCDFNLALKMPVDHGAPANIRDFDAQALIHRRIATRDHCFGCTAGCGSSCGGALV